MQASFGAVGKTIRMNRIFQEDGRAVMVAINQGIAMGPSKGIEDVRALMKRLMPEHPDSFTIQRGMAMRMADCYAGKAALVLKATNSTHFFGPDETPVASVKDALLLGADAISVGLSLMDPKEQLTLSHTARLISEAEQFGLPTVAHAYPNGNLIDDSVRFEVESVGYAVRVALELGIDIIKSFWTGSGESFARIVEIGAPAKVVISGGPRCDTLRQCFDMTWQGIQAGAHGITYGRNIWEHEYPAAVLRGLVAIIHKNATADEAMAIAEEVAGVKLV